MCGIAGQLAFPSADPQAVRRMADALAHRGPDGEGFHSDGPIALGHRRLSIIDIAGGAQPMFNGDGSVAVVFNGEIYNYKELRAELAPRHRFKTASDTEVLLHLYAELGDRLVERLRGMFAFALWDKPRRRLLAARDRFGEKPFLYCHRPGASFTFASELRALKASGLPLGDVDRAALSDYLELLYVPAPRTIYSGVRKLPAGNLLVADERGVEVRPYWRPPVPGSRVDRAPELGREIRECLREAVRLRLVSDVPIAALLSGGLDSSVVVALMAQELGPGVKTFSVGFGQADDELPWARLVADRWKTDHREILVSSEVATQVAEGLGAYSEPYGDSSSVPTVAVCKAVAQHVKVVLTGDGGDELFAGYGRYRRAARLPHVPFAGALERASERLPELPYRSKLRRLLRVAADGGEARSRDMLDVFQPEERAALLGGERRRAPGPPDCPSGDVDAALAFDLGIYLPDDLLVKMDIAAMRWGLEARCPLLDHELAALAVPPRPSRKQTARVGKLLLREAASDLLPPAILRREKRGFGSPVQAWLSGPLRGLVEDLLRPGSARVRDWLEGREIDRVLDRVVRGRGNAHQGWALLALESWARAAC